MLCNIGESKRTKIRRTDTLLFLLLFFFLFVVSLVALTMYSLEVTLVRAQDLPESDFGFMGIGGKSDPYVVFKVGKVTQKSSVINNNLSPVWSPPESFTFKVDNPKERVLEIQVLDYDRFNKDDLLGTLTLALAPFAEQRGASEVLSYEVELAEEFDNHKKHSYLFLEIKLVSLEHADRVLELWENQRYHLIKKWTTDTLLPNDRKRWSAIGDSNASSDSFEEVAPRVPPGMTAEGWSLDVSQGDDNGWIYAPSFQGPWQKDAFSLAMVRRRKWVNRCTYDNQSA